jgi:hypothetical protein
MIKASRIRSKILCINGRSLWIICLGVSLALAALHKYCTAFGMAVNEAEKQSYRIFK